MTSHRSRRLDQRPRRRVVRLAEAISLAVTRFEELALSGGILGIAALTIGNVATRTAVGKSLFFAEEVSQFLIVLVTFVGVGYAAGKGRHIRMTALYDQLPPRWRKAVMLVISSTTAVLLFFLCYLALDYVLNTVRALGSVSPVLRVPRWLVYLVAPLGFFLAGCQFALAFVRNVVSSGVYSSFEVRDEHAAEPEHL